MNILGDRRTPPESVASEFRQSSNPDALSGYNRQRAAAIARRVEQWFPRAARPLPWRTWPRNLYYALVVESMSQQTQIARVAERFTQFVREFPTVQSLAAAAERDVMAQWSGLGYYRRARHLHLAARVIVERHGGQVPTSVPALLELPGIGPYTAGAIASIAGGERTPIVDGNVTRVLLRIGGRDLEPGTAEARRYAWAVAGALVAASSDPAVFNEGLIELGATVCVPPPGSPECHACPLADVCTAHRKGLTGRIPRPKRAVPAQKRPLLYCASVVVRDARERVLVVQRPGAGLWAGLWQAPTVERADRRPTRAEAARAAGLRATEMAPSPRESFEHLTSHRLVRFDVWEALGGVTPRKRNANEWVFESGLARLGLSTPQRRILSRARRKTQPGTRTGATGPPVRRPAVA